MTSRTPRTCEPPTYVVLIDRYGVIKDVQSPTGERTSAMGRDRQDWAAGQAYLDQYDDNWQRAAIEDLLAGRRGLLSFVRKVGDGRGTCEVIVGTPVGTDGGRGAILMHMDLSAWVGADRGRSEEKIGRARSPERLDAQFIQETLSGALEGQFGGNGGARHQELMSLTPRQREVLQLVGAGKNNLEIGKELSCSLNTVKRHVTAVLQKLHLPNRTRAAMLAAEYGLIQKK
jgi:DNA-binding CsgD family transcriptional regulator